MGCVVTRLKSCAGTAKRAVVVEDVQNSVIIAVSVVTSSLVRHIVLRRACFDRIANAIVITIQIDVVLNAIRACLAVHRCRAKRSTVQVCINSCIVDIQQAIGVDIRLHDCVIDVRCQPLHGFIAINGAIVIRVCLDRSVTTFSQIANAIIVTVKVKSIGNSVTVTVDEAGRCNSE